jgi:hypothetical protein
MSCCFSTVGNASLLRAMQWNRGPRLSYSYRWAPSTFGIDPVLVFRNQPIVAVHSDDVGDMVVVLGNRVTPQVGTSYGTTLDLDLAPPQ